MNSLELMQLLVPLSNHTVGVYPNDLIPQIWQKPIAFICNTDDSKKPGSHWISIYVNKKSEAFFFDSYGLEPYVTNIANLLRKNCKTVKFNDRQIQSESSSVCGQFCLMFLYYMTHGIDANSFLNLFSEKNLLTNDKIAEEFVENLRRQKVCKKKAASFTGGKCKNLALQICCSRKRI